MVKGKKPPYGLCADIHFHNWLAFSTTLPSGVNSRLAGLLKEVARCADEIKAAGGNVMYVAGDVFHVRGSIAPSVLNPVLETFKDIIDSGVEVRILAGNHDLESKQSTRLGSAITALESVGVVVCNHARVFEDDHVCVIPWRESLDELKAEIAELHNALPDSGYDLILHAPIDGVIAGLPDHGLNAEFFDQFPNFDFVFAGHYHNHKELSHKVYSVGSLAQHSWSEVGARTGFLLVDENIRWFKSRLSQFVDITGDIDPDELPLIVEGNFIRCKTDTSSLADVNSLRAELEAMGARSVVIQSIKKPAATREGTMATTVSAGASIGVSVAEFAKSKSFPNQEALLRECASVLSEAGC